MSIVAECPHCETRFHLEPDLVGKSIRCPNLDCRQVFVVREAAKPPAPAPTARPEQPPPTRIEPPRVKPRNPTGAVGDLVPVVEAEPLPLGDGLPYIPPLPPDPTDPLAAPEPLPPPPPPPPPARSAKPVPPRPRPPAPEPQVVEATVVAPPPAREVVWTPEAAPPGTRGRARAEAADDDEPPIRRRRKKKNRGPLILIAMIVAIPLLGWAIWANLLQSKKVSEDQLRQQAQDAYDKGDYAAAARWFEELAAEGGDEAPKYRFYADLSATRGAVGSAANRENPTPALKRFRGFVDAQKGSPFAKPDAGAGRDVYAAGTKLGEDVVAHAEDRVRTFRGDRSNKADELRKAEEAVAAGRELLQLIEPFRGKDDPPPDKIAAGLDRVRADLDRERTRLDVLAGARARLAAPTDEAIEEAKREFAALALADDAEAQAVITGAEAEFLRRVRYEPDPAAPQAPQAPAAASLLFVSPIGPTRPPARGGLGDDAPPAVFLAVSRGVLYALDEDTGDLLWAVRVGADVTDPPAVARVELPDGAADLALVTSNVAGQPGLAAYALRTGLPRWHQPLPAPAAGPAVVVGNRAFVPVRDPLGSVFEFHLASGERVGKVSLGQRVGPAAVRRAGTGLVYVAAEARRVFVFDTDLGDDESRRPRCVRVIPTGHPPGTLRTPPVILGPAGDTPAERWLLLCQSDGPTAMKLRAFPVPPNPPLSPDAPPTAEPIAPEVELALPGWAWFPPVTDGERLAAATDAGQFRLFGLNQPGNKDPAVFALPHPTLSAPPGDAPVPGLVVPAEEGALWVLAGGGFQKFRTTLLPDRGLTLVPVGTAVPLGVPTQPAQPNFRGDTVCLVVRSANSSGARAVAVRLDTGEVRWQRQLGAVAATAPFPAGEGLLLVDEDGGAVAVPAGGLDVPAGTTKPAAEWVAAAAPDQVAGPTRVAVAPDGKTVFTVTPTGPAGSAKWVIRRIVDGKVEHTGSVNAPAAIAGPPAVMGGVLLLPAADGSVYRHNPGDGRARPDTLAPGPTWWTDRRSPDPVCFITPLADDAFVTSDGGRVLNRWNWPAAGGWVDPKVRWEVRERVAVPPLLVPGGAGRPARLLVADATGAVWLYSVDKPDQPVRRWVPGRTVSLPGGKVTSGFVPQPDAAGRLAVVYVVGGNRLVCLDPERDAPVWVAQTADDAGGVVVGSPRPAGEGRWVVTDLAGRVSVLDGSTGRAVLTREVGLPGAVPAAAAVPAGPRAVVPLSDGSAAVVDFPPEAPAPKE